MEGLARVETQGKSLNGVPVEMDGGERGLVGAVRRPPDPVVTHMDLSLLDTQESATFPPTRVLVESATGKQSILEAATGSSSELIDPEGQKVCSEIFGREQAICNDINGDRGNCTIVKPASTVQYTIKR